MRIWTTSIVIYLTACATRSHPPDRVPPPVTAATATSVSARVVRDDLAPPWSLTASDGTGLELARVDARAVVEGPLAFTELHLTFRNTEDRVREGTFQIALPPHAAVSRFAMAIDGKWQEAEVVGKLVARRAYDDFLHRRQDPALLEIAPGNQFIAKVFPIPARADKQLVISYSEPVLGSRYVLALRGLPRIGEIAVAVGTQRLVEQSWQPDRDFEVAVAPDAVAVGAGGMVVARVPIGGTTTRDVPAGITLLVDTSASRSLGFAAYVDKIRLLVGELRASWGDDLVLDVIAFDQACERVFAGRAADFTDLALRERGAAGASDLGQAVRWIASHGARSRVVVVGDGVITAGAEGRELAALVGGLGAVRVERLDFVLAGGLRDDRTAAALVRAGLPRAGAVLDLDRDPVARALGESVVTDLAIAVPDATWSYPRTIASARAGTHVLVFARVAGDEIAVVAGQQRTQLRVAPASQPLVERALAGAELAELEARRTVASTAQLPALRAQIAKQSVAARVLASETAMLVLETEADYARYRIDRAALPDILVAGARGVERVHRRAVIAGAGRTAEADTVEPRGDEPPPPPEPMPDHDHDAILDASDRCPDDPADDDDDGCPVRGRVVVSNASLVILQPVYFEGARAVIHSRSEPILQAVAQALRDTPDIEQLEVQGHTDERGDDAKNLVLSQQRAEAVMRYLVERGIAASRLSAQGYGETQPIDRAHTPAAWARNRRVDFLIVRRANGGGTSPAPAPPPPPPPPITGELAAVHTAIAAHDLDGALARARAWHAREPGNVLALVGLGDALEARHDSARAARIYGSIIDLYPGRADLRRFAGERLGRVAANDLAIDTLRRAVADRPDHLTGHRLLAYALVRANRPADAFAAILAGLEREYRDDSYRGGKRVLGEDAAMIGAVYATTSPAQRAAITQKLARNKLALATQPSTRFVLYWETDANDVDFHVRDAAGGHAYYAQKKLASGGELYADVTTGYGPECFTIPGIPRGGPYTLSAEYYAQGPMGFGMGLLQIQTFDPRGGIQLEDRPFVIMIDRARVDLGTHERLPH